MNFTDIAEWDRCTMEMIKNPKQGDHFTEHLGSVLLVTHRFGNWVAVRKPDPKKHQWGPQQVMRLSELRKYLTYDSIPDKPIGEGYREGFCPTFSNAPISGPNHE